MGTYELARQASSNETNRYEQHKFAWDCEKCIFMTRNDQKSSKSTTKLTIGMYLSRCVQISQNLSIFELFGYHEMAFDCHFMKFRWFLFKFYVIYSYFDVIQHKKWVS